jgi:hypothetical protein
MLKRRRLVIAVVGVGLLGTFLPELYWRVLGWMRNESFYQGRPTTWWVREIRLRYAPFNAPDKQLTLYTAAEVAHDSAPTLKELREAMHGPSHISFMRQYTASWYEESMDRITNSPRLAGVVYQGDRPTLLDGDPQALGLLMQLFASDDLKSRQLAACGLGELGKAAEHAIPALREACSDTDPIVSTNARWALTRIE